MITRCTYQRPAGCVLAALVAVFWLTAKPCCAQVFSQLTVGFTERVFEDVHKTDALAAMKVWIESMAERQGVKLDVTTVVYQDVESMRTLMETDSLDLVIIQTPEFFELGPNGRFKPFFAPADNLGPMTTHFILVRKDSGIKSIQDLRGKSVAIQQSARASFASIWLDTLTHEATGSRAHTYFKSITLTPKASRALLPVFFGNVDAAIVTESSFEVMKEMNPQLGSQMEAILTSPPLISSLVCMDSHYTEYRDLVLDSLATLHEDTKGKQILLVFRIAQLDPFNPEHLNDTLALMNAYHALPAEEMLDVP